jgi:hypothetical protein
MKKLIVLIVIVLCLPLLSVQATPPCADPGFSIEIFGSAGCDEASVSYHLDLLVKKVDVPTSVNEQQSTLYQELYGDIPSPDYLNDIDSEWTSYLAFVEGASYESWSPCYHAFAHQDDEYRHYSAIILVYFNDEGHTLFISEPLIMDQTEDDGGCRYGSIQFNVDQLTIENQYHHAIHPIAALLRPLVWLLTPLMRVADFLHIPYSIGTLLLALIFIVNVFIVLTILGVILIVNQKLRKKKQ